MSHPSFTLAFLTSHPLWFLCPLFPPFIGEEMYWNKMLWCSDCLLSFCPVTLLEACPMMLYPLCLLKNALSFQLLSSPVHTYSHSCLLLLCGSHFQIVFTGILGFLRSLSEVYMLLYKQWEMSFPEMWMAFQHYQTLPALYSVDSVPAFTLFPSMHTLVELLFFLYRQYTHLTCTISGWRCSH